MPTSKFPVTSSSVPVTAASYFIVVLAGPCKIKPVYLGIILPAPKALTMAWSGKPVPAPGVIPVTI